jgi:RNA polymerase sigma-70 factor (ECF subfamily)
LPAAPEYYATGAEALIVGLAQTGDKDAFSELVHRRQSWIRSLMRRLSGDGALADDLAQQTFLQAWRKLHSLRDRRSFGAWLKRLAVNTWLQHVRRHDTLRDAGDIESAALSYTETPGEAMDLDSALEALSPPARLCIVLSYQVNMTHSEIAESTGLPEGTVKSHIRRGSQRLQELLASYKEAAVEEDPS